MLSSVYGVSTYRTSEADSYFDDTTSLLPSLELRPQPCLALSELSTERYRRCSIDKSGSVVVQSGVDSVLTSDIGIKINPISLLTLHTPETPHACQERPAPVKRSMDSGDTMLVSLPSPSSQGSTASQVADCVVVGGKRFDLSRSSSPLMDLSPSLDSESKPHSTPHTVTLPDEGHARSHTSQSPSLSPSDSFHPLVSGPHHLPYLPNNIPVGSSQTSPLQAKYQVPHPSAEAFAPPISPPRSKVFDHLRSSQAGLTPLDLSQAKESYDRETRRGSTQFYSPVKSHYREGSDSEVGLGEVEEGELGNEDVLQVDQDAKGELGGMVDYDHDYTAYKMRKHKSVNSEYFSADPAALTQTHHRYWDRHNPSPPRVRGSERIRGRAYSGTPPPKGYKRIWVPVSDDDDTDEDDRRPTRGRREGVTLESVYAENRWKREADKHDQGRRRDEYGFPDRHGSSGRDRYRSKSYRYPDYGRQSAYDHDAPDIDRHHRHTGYERKRRYRREDTAFSRTSPYPPPHRMIPDDQPAHRAEYSPEMLKYQQDQVLRTIKTEYKPYRPDYTMDRLNGLSPRMQMRSLAQRPSTGLGGVGLGMMGLVGFSHGDVRSSSGTSPSGSQDQGAEGIRVKGTRRRVDDAQLRVLVEAFKRTAYPSTVEREALGRTLGMTSRSVQIWFQNRRRAIKVEQQSREQKAMQEQADKVSTKTAYDQRECEATAELIIPSQRKPMSRDEETFATLRGRGGKPRRRASEIDACARGRGRLVPDEEAGRRASLGLSREHLGRSGSGRAEGERRVSASGCLEEHEELSEGEVGASESEVDDVKMEVNTK